MITLLSFIWFIQAILILLALAGSVLLAKIALNVVRHNLDEGASLWFKVLQMNENIKDRIQERELKQDRAELILESAHQELRLKSGLSTLIIEGLEAEKDEKSEPVKVRNYQG